MKELGIEFTTELVQELQQFEEKKSVYMVNCAKILSLIKIVHFFC